MDLSPIEKWFRYSEDFYRKIKRGFEIDKEQKCIIFTKGEDSAEVWDDELYNGLTEALEKSAPPVEIEEWYANIVYEDGLDEINYNFEVLTKNYSILFSIFEDNDESDPYTAINVYTKGREAIRYTLKLENLDKEMFIFLEKMTEEIKKVFLNRKSTRIKHLMNHTEIFTGHAFENLYKKKMSE